MLNKNALLSWRTHMNEVIQTASRRNFLGKVTAVTLSATALALLDGNDAMAAKMKGKKGGDKMMANDVGILNVALGLEHEAINAYTLGAQSGLLDKGVLDVAVLFQSHHKGHRDALIATINKMGGKPVAEKTLAQYAADLNAGSIKSAGDILQLARRLELGAVNAYLGVIPSLNDKELGKVAARLAADETMHWTLLNSALGGAAPAGPLTFGA
jgi:Ferritin-like domain